MTIASAPEPVPFTSADQYVGDRVYVEMRRRRLSQTAVATQLGMGQSNLSKKLAGERGWSLDELLAASRYFAISLDELMPGPEYVPAPMREDVDELSARRNAEGPGPHEEDRGQKYGIRDSNPEPADSEHGTLSDIDNGPGVVVTLAAVRAARRRTGNFETAAAGLAAVLLHPTARLTERSA